jgi:hypothetical protein
MASPGLDQGVGGLEDVPYPSWAPDLALSVLVADTSL